MADSTFQYPVPSTSANNSSYTIQTRIFVKDCSLDAVLADCPPAWNDTRCANDENYCEPYTETDKIYLQFRYSPLQAKRFELWIVDCETGNEVQLTAPTDYIFETGMPSHGEFYQNVIFTPSEMPYTCFVMKFKVFGCITSVWGTPCDTEELIATWCSDQYCPVKCDEQTILIEAIYPKYDCFGHYYKAFALTGGPNSYKAQVRVRAEMIQDAYNFTETYVGVDLSRKDLSERFSIIARKLPPYVAEKVAVCFGGQKTLIDGIAYKKAVTIEKNFDEGLSWLIKTTVFKECINPFMCS